MSISRPSNFRFDDVVVCVSVVGRCGHRRRPRCPPRLRSNRRSNYRSGVAALPPYEGRRHARHELRGGAGGDVPLRQGDERRDRPRGIEAEAPGVSVVALAGSGVFRPFGVFGGVRVRWAVEVDVGGRGEVGLDK